MHHPTDPPSAPVESSATMRTAVIVDADDAVRSELADLLTQQGFAVTDAADGVAGIDAVRRTRPDIVTVDVTLPGIDGYEAVRRIREFSAAYVLMISAKGGESAIVEGLRSGADDYLVKPFGAFELRARIDALLRRPRLLAVEEPAVDASAWFELSGLRLHPASRRVDLGGDPCELTRSEFDILHALIRADDQVLSKAALALMLREQNGLPGDHITSHDCHAVEVHIMNLRRKLRDDPRAPQWVQTVRGLGYRFLHSGPVPRTEPVYALPIRRGVSAPKPAAEHHTEFASA